jgi:hypothetical protein
MNENQCENEHCPAVTIPCPLKDAASSEPREWTPEYVRSLREATKSVSMLDWDVAIADAHNDALAAEREKFQKAKEWNQVAEIELRNARSLYCELLDDFKKVSEELAAEREKVKTLVEALKTIADADPNRVGQSQYKIIAIHALKLAKVKKGK